MTGRLLSERLGRWAFWLMFVGFNAAFLPMHVTGLSGMPRRVYTYAGDLGWNALNLVSSVFAFVFAAGVLVFIVDFAWHLRRGREAGDNPWQAPSLEWLSGQSQVGFRSLPPITSRYPLWDKQNLREHVEEPAGATFPDAPTGERESLVTAPLDGSPEQIIRLPGPGWVGFVSALAIAVSLAAATFKVMPAALAFGAIGTVALLFWLWSMDRDLPRGAGGCRTRPRPAALPQRQGLHRLLGHGRHARVRCERRRRLRVLLPVPVDGPAGGLAAGRDGAARNFGSLPRRRRGGARLARLRSGFPAEPVRAADRRRLRLGGDPSPSASPPCSAVG